MPITLIFHAASNQNIGSHSLMQPILDKYLAELLYEEYPTPRKLLDILPIERKNLYIFDSRVEHHRSYEELFEIFSNGDVFIADIHDLVHHGTQMLIWKNFIQRLGHYGKNACNERSVIMKSKAVFLLYTCLEYSIVNSMHGPYSAGCLNWQSPRKSPAEMIQYYPICAGCINNWNINRAMCSLFRRQEEYSQLVGLELQWLRELGYTGTITNNTYNVGNHNSKYKNLYPESMETLLESALRMMSQ